MNVKILLACLVCVSFSYASVTKKLSEAKAYEEAGEYQKAMQIYKSLATKDLGVDQTSVAVEQNITPYKDEATNQSVEQAIYGLYGLKPYHSNYFLPLSYSKEAKVSSGSKDVESKFQISIQKELANNLLGYNESYSLGYTQISWWQSYADSAYFRETNYAPEFFVRVPIENSVLKAVQVGLLHESNGRGGVNERSWNRAYLQGFFQVKGLFIIPRIWQQFDVKYNRDIRQYMGYGDLKLFYPYKENFFKRIWRNNFDFNNNRNGLELNWSFPLFNTGLFGYLQYFNGYGESLIDYNRNVNRVSLGIAISR